MIASIVWAGVVLYLLWRTEIGFKSWLKHQEPLNTQQYNELSKRLNEVQAQVNSLSIQREID